jgi:hypothetical protein
MTFAVLWVYPFLEKWWTGDRLYHNLLDRPRDRPGRTALGVAGFTFYLVLTVAGAQDVLGYYLNLQQVPITYALRGILIGLPVLTGFLAWRVCLGLRGVPVEPPELPKDRADSVMPPTRRYLPERAQWQDTRTGEPVAAGAANGSRAWLRRAATAGAATVIGLLAVKRARSEPVGRIAGRGSGAAK